MDKEFEKLKKTVEEQNRKIREMKNVITIMDRRATKVERGLSRLNHTVRNITNSLNVVLKMLRKD